MITKIVFAIVTVLCVLALVWFFFGKGKYDISNKK